MLLFRNWPTLFLVFGALGCGSLSRQEFDALQRLQVAHAYARRDYKLQPGDTVKVTVFRGAEFPREYDQQIALQPDGKINLVAIDRPLQAEGLTVSELEGKVRDAYRPQFERPDTPGGVTARWFVSVQFLTSVKADWLPDQVFVTGQVRAFGGGGLAVPYRRGLSVIQAIAVAGGWNDRANTRRVVLLRMNSEGRTVTREIDLENIVQHAASDLELFPGDIVYVPMSFIAQLNVWVNFYVRGLLPINPSVIPSYFVP